MRDPTPYPELNGVLRELVAGVQGVLGAGFVAACLQGSFAVGDFDPDSDVDFIVVTEADLTEPEVRSLQALHGRVYDLACGWAQHLEGSYFPKDVLRAWTRRGTPLWYLDHGSRTLIEDGHCNTAIVRWVVREKGVPLAGPDPATLVDPVPVATLREEILAVMHGWGQAILADSECINNRFYQTYAVLNYCRMLHDLHMGSVGSKRAGAEWAQTTLDSRWADLIDRAWAGRPDPARSAREPADPGDLKRTVEFVRVILDASTQAAAGLP